MFRIKSASPEALMAGSACLSVDYSMNGIHAVESRLYELPSLEKSLKCRRSWLSREGY